VQNHVFPALRLRDLFIRLPVDLSVHSLSDTKTHLECALVQLLLAANGMSHRLVGVFVSAGSY